MTGQSPDERELRDYIAWHDDYDRPGSELYLRLLVVQDLISRALEELPPGPVRFVSMCAGQGRDILTVARRHRRGGDLKGRLVELEPTNVAAARDQITAHRIPGIEVVETDAGYTDAYVGAAPADLVLACGVFGNISDGDIERTIRAFPTLCSPGAWVIWTRQPTGAEFPLIPGWIEAAGFTMEALVVSERERFSVGAARLTGEALPFRPGERLFTFVR